jgi:FeS assembly SUF system regulator
MFRIGKLTDYASVVMTLLAEQDEGVRSATELAALSRLEPPTVSKLLKSLAQAKLVVATRGAHGGYRLARPAAQISVADIIAAMEGPIGFTECATHAGRCDHETHCGVRGNWRHISGVVEAALSGITLADMLVAAPPSSRRTARVERKIPLALLAAD